MTNEFDLPEDEPCYVISVVVWILALSRVPVSIAFPMLSMAYVVNAVAAMKAGRKAPEARPASADELTLWPRDMSGVAVAAVALAVMALMIGWSGSPSQEFDQGDELASGRMP